jgi:beta-lactamase class A
MKRFVLLHLIGLSLALAALAQQVDPRAADLRAKLAREVQRAAAEFDGVMGVAVKDLASGDTFFANADMVFPQASSIKIPVLLELMRQAQAGALKLSERIELRKPQMVGGSGVLLRFSDGGSALSLHDLAVLMIVLSDNTATNLLIDKLGMGQVNDNLERLGLKQTRLQRVMLDVESQRASRENLSTPREMVTLLELLDAGKTLDPRHSQLALEILKYPKTSALRAGIPSNVQVAHKPGGIAGVSCDSAIVYLPNRPYLISVMTTYGGDAEATARAITEISRKVFSYFERLARSNSLGARVP